MSTNYSEQIFQAVDTIVSQRLNEVSFDKTEICKIVSEDTSAEGKYWVTNDVLRFEAYSTDPDKSYMEGQKVYVTIPSGDYSMRKIIIGSYSSDEIPKNLYTNPFDHLIASSEISIPTSDLKVKANSDNSEKLIASATKTGLTFHYSGLGQFNYIGLDFSATTGFGGTIGEFQIMIDLLNNSGTSLLTNEQKGLLTFSSRQLYGNPYYLTPALHFQHLFNFPLEYNNAKFSDLTKVKQIKVTLRSLGNFNYPNTVTTTDISINSLKLYFGFDSSEDSMSENTLALVLDNPVNNLEYSTATDEKKMSIDWRNLTTNAIYNETDNKQYPVSGEYYVYWLQYSESIGYTKTLETSASDMSKIDIDESGTYWKTVQKKDANQVSAYSYTLKPCEDWKKEQIKVIIKHKDGDYIESNGLTFTNKNFRSETGSNQGSQDTLKLTLAEGDDGVYNSYGIDNKLLSSYNLEHSLTVSYIDNTKWDKELQKVIWKIPKNSTMIKQPEGWVEKDSFYTLKVNSDTSDIDGKTIKFNLSDQFSYNKTNNTIYCEITRYKNKDSDVITDTYKGSITLQFGLQGTVGTGWAFNIVSSQRALATKSTGQNKMTLTATFEDAEGKPIDENSWKNKVKWSWYQTQYETSEATKRYTMSAVEGKTTIITRNSYIDCYAIVQAKLEDWQDKNGNKIDLVAYMPIAAGNPSHYLTGAARVIYNNAGTSPSYDEAPYVLYQSDHTVANSKDYTYSIISPETNKNKYFTINANEGNLKPLSLLPTQIPKMALQVYDNKNKQASYVQPILILKNGYQSKMLNEWDGNLKIDNENNSIFSALMGAGIKNDDNTFTGVLMGAVGKTLSTAKTGIYGVESGELRYKLDEKGDFYVGTGSDNKIDFSGATNKTLTIEAKSFKLKVGNDLYFSNTAEASNEPYWLRFKDKVYFETNGTATIGGWTIENNRIENIKTEDKRFYISANPTSGTYDSWIAAGKYDSKNKKWNWPFYVDKNGILYASGAVIEGTLKTDIANITGTITANRIDVTGVINAGSADIQGIVKATEISANKITTGTLTANRIDVAGIISAGSADIQGIVKATEISASKITTGDLSASRISGGTLTVGNITWSGQFGSAQIPNLNANKITGGTLKLTTTLYGYTYTTSLDSSGFSLTAGASSFNLHGAVDEQEIWLEMGSSTLIHGGDYTGLTLESGSSIYLSGTDVNANGVYLQSGSNGRYWVCFGNSAGSLPPRIKGQGTNLYLHAEKGGAIYAGGEDSNDKIATQGGSPSTLNLKTSLVNIKTDYNNLYQELQQINMYNYDYQYDNLNNENIAKYGFIIDEIENTQYLSQYFKHYDKYGKIINNNLIVATQNDYDIQYKIWDRDSYIKGQFILIKTLQNKIDQLEKEIKEIKQNEI